MSVSEDARKTADEIRRRGWVQGIERDRDGSCCIVGAYNLSNGVDPFTVLINNDFLQAVGDFTGERVVDWNDAKGRTKEEVLEMLENVAIKHESDEARQVPGGGGAGRDSMWG